MKILSFLLFSLTLFAAPPNITSTLSMQEVNKLTASDPVAYDFFGYRVAISGGTVVISSVTSHSNGSAFIYELNSSSNTFMQRAELRASDPADHDNFGCSVAISGDIVIVGAYRDDDGGADSGSAYLFEKPSTGWANATEDAKLTASDAAPYDYFGYSVAISGDTVIVGANNGDGEFDFDSGSAYLFEKPSTGWATATEDAKLTTSNNIGPDYSVAISGDTVILGAIRGRASAYLFEKPSTGWANATEDAILIPSDSAESDRFGVSVAISGETVILCRYDHYLGGFDSGSAYLFEKPLSGWATATEDAKLTASDAAPYDYFGYSVAISGDTVIVGAYRDDDGGSASGSAYLFEKPSTGWGNATTEDAKLTANDAAANDYFGFSVAISGETIIVGAYVDDESGSAYHFQDVLFTNTIENKKEVIDIEASDPENDTITFSIIGGDDAVLFTLDAVSGLLSFKSAADYEAPDDANSDNIYKLVLKLSDAFGESRTYQSLVRVSDLEYEGKAPKAISFKELNALRVDNPMDNAYFGISVAISGDTAVIGALGYNGSAGAAYIYELNSSSNTFMQKAQLKTYYPTDDYFGYSVAISGDTVIVGAYVDDDGGTSSGSAYLFEKPSTGWANATEDAKLTASDAAAYDYFGRSVAISGDTAVVGAYWDDDGGIDSGSAYLFEKPSTGWATATEDAKLTASYSAAGGFFGFSVAISGETIIVGQGREQGGYAFLFEKPLSGWVDATEDTVLWSYDSWGDSYFGYSVAISGDTVIVGAPGEADGDTASGSAYLFEKPSTGWVDATVDAKLTASDAAAYDYFGFSVAISGDTVIVGAYEDDDGGLDSGSAYLFEKPLSGWATATEDAKLTASDAAPYDYFGYSVAISGDTAVVGAYADDDVGASYIYKAKELTLNPAIIMYLLN